MYSSCKQLVVIHTSSPTNEDPSFDDDVNEESQTSDWNAGGFIRRYNSKEVKGNEYIWRDDKSQSQFQHHKSQLLL